MGHWAFLPVRDKHFELQKSWVPVKSFKIHDVAHKKGGALFWASVITVQNGTRLLPPFYRPFSEFEEMLKMKILARIFDFFQRTGFVLFVSFMKRCPDITVQGFRPLLMGEN